ncbi:MAG TPA: hypothetical protein VFW66_06595 [Gemmatimonadales bacterium]|nr:hypothetical protein [Gemmatimonadales bacterium]
MFAMTLKTMRRLPLARRFELQVAYAQAWEALTETHQRQAVIFVHRMADRLPLMDALARYFREVAVPIAMQETVRARALLAVARQVPAESDAGAGSENWERLRRPDRWVDVVRRRAHHVEETTLHSRMAACVAEAAVVATHVRMAVEVSELLTDDMTVDEAVMVYVRSFDLPVKEGDAVFRAALAQLAERRLQANESPKLRIEHSPAPALSAPQLAAPASVESLPAPAFGLRVIV